MIYFEKVKAFYSICQANNSDVKISIGILIIFDLNNLASAFDGINKLMSLIFELLSTFNI